MNCFHKSSVKRRYIEFDTENKITKGQIFSFLMGNVQKGICWGGGEGGG